MTARSAAIAIAIAGLLAACGPDTAPAPFVDPGATDAAQDTLAPEVTDPPTPALLTIKTIDGAGTVARGHTATVEIQTTKGALCSIDVEYNSGSSSAAGLVDRTANAAGGIRWAWTVGTRTATGSYPVTILCVKGDREGELDLTLNVK